MAAKTKITSPRGILSFPTVFEPRAAVEGGDLRYSVNLIFSPEVQKTKEYQDMLAAIEACAKEYFGSKLPPQWRHPVRKASERDYAGYEDGHTFISAWSKQKPGIVGPSREEIDLPEEVWAGQEARITMVPFGYNVPGNKGVGLGLNNLQITKRNMPRLDGKTSATRDFDEIASDDELEDAPF